MADALHDFDVPETAVATPVLDLRRSVAVINLTDEARVAMQAEYEAIQGDPDPTLLGSIEHRLQLLSGGDGATEVDQARELLLRSLWHQARAVSDVSAQHELDRAVADLRAAVYGLAALGAVSERDSAVAFGRYAEALRDLHDGNVGSALIGIEEARELLGGVPELHSEFEGLIDAFEVDALGVRAARCMQAGAIDEATSNYLTAAKKAAQIAARSEGPPAAIAYYNGAAKLNEAMAAFLDASVCLNAYAFDRMPPDRASVAAEAAELLAEANAPELLQAQARFLGEMLGVEEEIAAMMTRVLDATFKPDVAGFKSLHGRVGAARSAIAAEGTGAMPFVRVCDVVDDQLTNLERLVRPKRRDFGVYSGLLACAIFVPLLVVVAAVNRFFDLGASAVLVFWICIVLALIAGFGFGAVRFKSLLTASKATGM